jgi:hypothetical protein
VTNVAVITGETHYVLRGVIAILGFLVSTNRVFPYHFPLWALWAGAVVAVLAGVATIWGGIHGRVRSGDQCEE